MPIDFGLQHLRLHVPCPVDLTASKISRCSDVDKQDMKALVALGLTGADDIEQRALTALGAYVERGRICC